MSWNEEEIESLKSMLLSADERNLQIAMELIKQRKDAMPFAELLCFISLVKTDWDHKLELKFNKQLRKLIPEDLVESIKKQLSIFNYYDIDDKNFASSLESYQEKKAIYETFMRLNPSYASSYHRLGDYLARQKEFFEDGLSFLKKAVEFNPQKFLFHFQYAFHLPEIPSNYDAILYHYEQSYQLGMKDKAIFHNLGRAYLVFFAEYEKSKKIFEEGLSLYPGFSESMISLADALMEIGKKEEAEAMLLEVIAGHPKNGRALNNLAFMYLDSFKDFKNARIYSKKAVQAEPKNAVFWHTLAEIEWFGYQDAEKAIKALDKASKVNKTYKAAAIMKKKIEKEMSEK